MAEDERNPSALQGEQALKRISTKDLFAGGLTEIRIEHEGMEYRLRITRQNKLILYR